MKLGIIADDYTGGTDSASFLVKEGLTCIQLSGVQQQDVPLETDVIVVSLKSRTEPADKAMKSSLEVYHWLKSQGCDVIQFKYCSTFDSAEQGNIGPVSDAILAANGFTSTIIVPSLPVNGRKVFYGNLFVKGEPLNESGMKDHPLTPMRDANLCRLMRMQTEGQVSLIDFETVEQGPTLLREAFHQLEKLGNRYIIIDAFTEAHLEVIGTAFVDYPFVTGASGLTHGLAKAISKSIDRKDQAAALVPSANKTVILSGSCSTQTNRQVDFYKDKTNTHYVDIDKLNDIESYSLEIAQWLESLSADGYAPLICATVNKYRLSEIRELYDFDVSACIEALFTNLVKNLKKLGYCNYICAGGETSGAVTQGLGVKELLIGKLICPGVPWVSTLDRNIFLALKSGNFGDDDFFFRAQSLIENRGILNEK